MGTMKSRQRLKGVKCIGNPENTGLRQCSRTDIVTDNKLPDAGSIQIGQKPVSVVTLAFQRKKNRNRRRRYMATVGEQMLGTERWIALLKPFGANNRLNIGDRVYQKAVL